MFVFHHQHNQHTVETMAELGARAHRIILKATPLVEYSLITRRDVLLLAALAMPIAYVRFSTKDEFVSAVAGYVGIVWVLACVFTGLMQHWFLSVKKWARFSEVRFLAELRQNLERTGHDPLDRSVHSRMLLICLSNLSRTEGCRKSSSCSVP